MFRGGVGGRGTTFWRLEMGDARNGISGGGAGVSGRGLNISTGGRGGEVRENGLDAFGVSDETLVACESVRYRPRSVVA
jgi:hypothetical protein